MDSNSPSRQDPIPNRFRTAYALRKIDRQFTARRAMCFTGVENESLLSYNDVQTKLYRTRCPFPLTTENEIALRSARPSSVDLPFLIGAVDRNKAVIWANTVYLFRRVEFQSRPAARWEFFLPANLTATSHRFDPPLDREEIHGVTSGAMQLLTRRTSIRIWLLTYITKHFVFRMISA